MTEGQSYSMNGRSLTLANTRKIREQIQYWERRVQAFQQVIQNNQQAALADFSDMDRSGHRKNKGDSRPESYKIINTDAITLHDEVSTERNWAERKRLILDRNTIHTDLAEIISHAHADKLGIVV